LLRRLFKQCIDAVNTGQDPVGVVRDPVKNQIIRLAPGEYKLDQTNL